MTKKLNESALQSELSEGSAFFQQAPEGHETTLGKQGGGSSITKQAAQVDRKQDSKPDGKLASTLARTHDAVVETIRRIIKSQGKEVSYIRMTPEEKAELAEIVYTYKRRGFKTSENEINRVAVNCMLEDYKVNGRNSLLAKVLDALAA